MAYVVRGGMVIDGTGAAARRADVLVEGGRIVQVGPVDAGQASEVIEADDLVVAPGCFADLVVFDPATIGPGKVHTRADLPGGGSRLFSEATGIEHVIVNGEPLVQGGQPTGKLPGRLMSAGIDTETVAIPAFS